MEVYRKMRIKILSLFYLKGINGYVILLLYLFIGINWDVKYFVVELND